MTRKIKHTQQKLRKEINMKMRILQAIISVAVTLIVLVMENPGGGGTGTMG